MAKSKTMTKNTEMQQDEQPAVSASVLQQPAKRKPAPSARRVPVHYTPRIPSARCPGC